jgi:hypothetical protein
LDPLLMTSVVTSDGANAIYQIDLAAIKADGVKLRDGIDANRKSYTMLGITLGVTMMIALIGWALTLGGIHIH